MFAGISRFVGAVAQGVSTSVTHLQEAAPERLDAFKHASWTGSRMLILLAFGALLVLRIIPSDVVYALAIVLAAWQISNGYTSGKTTEANMLLKQAQLKHDFEMSTLALEALRTQTQNPVVENMVANPPEALAPYLPAPTKA